MSAELCERAHISKKNAVKNRLELATPQSQRAREIAGQYIPHPASSIGKAWESANRPGPTRLKIDRLVFGHQSQRRKTQRIRQGQPSSTQALSSLSWAESQGRFPKDPPADDERSFGWLKRYKSTVIKVNYLQWSYHLSGQKADAKNII